MKAIAKKETIRFTDIVFVDNSIENLKSIRKLGCVIALASWGTNYKQIEEAEKLYISTLGKSKLVEHIEELMQ